MCMHVLAAALGEQSPMPHPSTAPMPPPHARTHLTHTPLSELSNAVIPRYLAGHNDVLAGAIAGRSDLVAAVRHTHNILGGVIDPHASYLVLRGMKTLDLRVERQVGGGRV